MVNSQKQLAISLSKLQVFDKPSARLEQYPTDSEVAAEVLWFAFQRDEIEGKIIADLGCGTGILGIGALMLGAKKVFFVDIDGIALKRLKENLGLLGFKDRHEIVCMDVSLFKAKCDLVIQNPPFGVQTEHADRKFLLKAFEVGDIIYSLHKFESERFLSKLGAESSYRITNVFRFDFPIKSTMAFHTSRIKRIDVGCFRFEKI